MPYYIRKAIENTKSYGWRDTAIRAWRVLQRPTAGWRTLHQRGLRQERYEKWILEENAREKTQDNGTHDLTPGVGPLFSILVPLYETDERFLRELILSVQAQTYSNWELCFSDGSRDKSRLTEILRPYLEQDPRIRYTAEHPGPLGISANTNQAYSISQGEFIVLGDHDDLFEPEALSACAQWLRKDPSAEVFYTDEDKTDETGKRFFDPSCKPALNWPLLHSCNYITHMFVAKRSVVEAAGLLDERFNGAQDYDFILRCLEKTNRVVHIPRVLYHWRINSTSTAGNPNAKRYAYDAGALALQEHYERMGILAKAELSEDMGYYRTVWQKEERPLLSVIIMDAFTRRQARYMMKILKEREPDLQYEILLTDWSENPHLCHDRRLSTYLEKLRQEPGMRILRGNRTLQNGDNLAEAANEAAAQAKGEYICLLSSRFVSEKKGSLEEMLQFLVFQDNCGAVGPKILCVDGKVRHAGVILGKDEIPAAEQLRMEYYDDVLFSMQAFSALRKECLLTKTSLFREAGGLDHSYQMYSSAILEYCLKLTEAGKDCLYAGRVLMHYEPHKRKKDKQQLYEEARRADEEMLNERWKKILQTGDRYYGERLKRQK